MWAPAPFFNRRGRLCRGNHGLICFGAGVRLGLLKVMVSLALDLRDGSEKRDNEHRGADKAVLSLGNEMSNSGGSLGLWISIFWWQQAQVCKRGAGGSVEDTRPTHSGKDKTHTHKHMMCNTRDECARCSRIIITLSHTLLNINSWSFIHSFIHSGSDRKRKRSSNILQLQTSKDLRSSPAHKKIV